MYALWISEQTPPFSAQVQCVHVTVFHGNLRHGQMMRAVMQRCLRRLLLCSDFPFPGIQSVQFWAEANERDWIPSGANTGGGVRRWGATRWRPYREMYRAHIRQETEELQSHGGRARHFLVQNSGNPCSEGERWTLLQNNRVIVHSSSLTFILLISHQVYWFKDGKQILRKNVHYKKIREGDGTCALHIESTTNDDDGNYTVMAANPQVIHWTSCLCHQQLPPNCKIWFSI